MFLQGKIKSIVNESIIYSFMVFIQHCQRTEFANAYFENYTSNNNGSGSGIEPERVSINLWNKSVQIHTPVTNFYVKSGFDETMHHVNIIKKDLVYYENKSMGFLLYEYGNTITNTKMQSIFFKI